MRQVAEKTCSKCGVVKPLDDFYDRNSKRYIGTGVKRADCKTCHLAFYKKRYAGSEKVQEGHYHSARKHRLSLYNLTVQDYEAILSQQKGVCAICGLVETWEVKGRVVNLCVDHCHETNKVRGLLCRACNAAIGQLYHDEEILNRAIKYLRGDIKWED